MSKSSVGCPECPHCQAKALKAVLKADQPLSGAQLLARAIRRPWQQPHYGQKITSFVDWLDGNHVGSYAKSKDEAVPPRQIKDPQSWLEGFAEGWADAAWCRAGRKRASA